MSTSGQNREPDTKHPSMGEKGMNGAITDENGQEMCAT